MKKLVLFLIPIAFWASCTQTPEEPSEETLYSVEDLPERIQAAIQKDFPEGYSVVRTYLVDTVTYQDNLSKVISFVEGRRTFVRQNLERDSLAMQALGPDVPEEQLASSKQNLENLRIKLAQDELRLNYLHPIRDSLLESRNPDAIAAYLYIHDCKIPMEGGGQRNATFLVQVGRRFDILGYAENPARLDQYPGGFPGKEKYDQTFR